MTQTQNLNDKDKGPYRKIITCGKGEKTYEQREKELTTFTESLYTETQKKSI
jgi:hypothetical protein